MKYKDFNLVEVLVVLLIIAVLAAVLFPVLATRHHPDNRAGCASNLKQILLGFQQYIQDYDEKFPLTGNVTVGWGAAIYPYVKSDQIFQCPTDKSGGVLKTTDYFANARLSSVGVTKLEDISFTILIADGLGNQRLNAHLLQLPATWRKDSGSPAFRHLDGANYAFADGHVKWFKPEQITLEKPSASQPTFLLGRSQP